MKTFLLFLLGAICLSGCQSSTTGNKNYQIAKLTKNDSTFLALKDTAQAHLNIFIDSILAHTNDTANYRFAVKSDFVEKDTHEHMCSRILTFDNGVFKGIFIDSAFELKNIKTGDKIAIGRKDIEDWSILNFRTGETTGDYSDAYLRKKAKQ